MEVSIPPDRKLENTAGRPLATGNRNLALITHALPIDCHRRQTRSGLGAVRAGDAGRLAELESGDIVVVHGNIRCVPGKDELKMDFLNDLLQLNCR